MEVEVAAVVLAPSLEFGALLDDCGSNIRVKENCAGVSQQLQFIHTRIPGILEVGGQSANIKKKKREVTFKGLRRPWIEPRQNFRC